MNGKLNHPIGYHAFLRKKVEIYIDAQKHKETRYRLKKQSNCQY